MKHALIVVDVQNDFCEGGSLAVAGGNHVAEGISRIHFDRYDFAVATMDWHVDPGAHFSDTPDYTNSWPVHCVAGTIGAGLHPALAMDMFAAIFRKGRFEAAYSGFEGRWLGRRLERWLMTRKVDSVDICGLATDYCVRATALDAVAAGFKTTLLTEYCAGVSPGTSAAAITEMANTGVTIL